MTLSDFHNEAINAAPCEFARTHVLVPIKSYVGILKGLEAGTFWAEHGKIPNFSYTGTDGWYN
jgi:hypothetical protein